MKCLILLGVAICLFLMSVAGVICDEVDILTYANDAKIFSVTTQKNDSTYSVKNVMDGLDITGWRTADNMPYPDTIGIVLPCKYILSEFVVNNKKVDYSYYKGTSVRDFELYGSVASKYDGYQMILSGEAKNKKRKVFKVKEALEVKWLKLVITSNWGNGEYTDLMEIEAYGNPVKEKD